MKPHRTNLASDAGILEDFRPSKPYALPPLPSARKQGISKAVLYFLIACIIGIALGCAAALMIPPVKSEPTDPDAVRPAP